MLWNDDFYVLFLSLCNIHLTLLPHFFQGLTGNRRFDDFQHNDGHFNVCISSWRERKGSWDNRCSSLFRFFRRSFFRRSFNLLFWLESHFFANIPVGFFIIVFTFLKLKGEWTEARGEKFDWIGSILYGFTLVMVMYGFSLLPGIKGAFFILMGLLGGWAFVKWEMKSESPVFNIHLFINNKVFAFSNLAALINYSATYAVSFLLSLYLQLIKGLNPQEAGLILVSQPIVQAVFSPFAGRISDRIEPRKLASIGMALTAVGLFLFVFLGEKTSIPFIVASLIFIGFGFSLFSSPNTNAVMSSVEERSYGVASGMLGTMRTMGMMFSMGMVMLVFSIFIGRIQITPSYYPLFIKSVKAAFIIFTVFCSAGIFASLSRGSMR